MKINDLKNFSTSTQKKFVHVVKRKSKLAKDGAIGSETTIYVVYVKMYVRSL